MNKLYIIFFFFHISLFSQVSLSNHFTSSKIPITFSSNDTILSIPFSMNHMSFFTIYPITDFFTKDDDFKIDFDNYIHENKNINMSFFSENNIVFYGFPVNDSFYSFGINHYAYGRLNLSNELINLFWNGNQQYLDHIVDFENNRSSFMQFSSIFFQYSWKLNQYRMGARLNLLHGINYFNLHRANFSLNSVSDLVTPFSTYISTDIHSNSSEAKLIGFSNPGLSIDYAVDFDIYNWNFSFELDNIGFIVWNKNSFNHQSDGEFFFDGIDYSMDQIISEEFENTIDTLSDIFAINRSDKKTFITRLPLRFDLDAKFSINSSTKFFMHLHSIEELSEEKSIDFFNLYFLGFIKEINKNTTLYSAYNYNKFSHANLSFGIVQRFNNFLLKLNTNNLFSVFNGKYIQINTGLYYFF